MAQQIDKKNKHEDTYHGRKLSGDPLANLKLQDLSD